MNGVALRAAVAVAAVYGFFLIFAQFSFVELLRAGGASLTMEKTALGIMAAAGISGGFLAAWRGVTPVMVRIALGGGHGPLSWHFARPPANLSKGPFIWSGAGEDLDLRIARVIKFGIPGTDMPGHESLPDSDVLAPKDYVLGFRR